MNFTIGLVFSVMFFINPVDPTELILNIHNCMESHKNNASPVVINNYSFIDYNEDKVEIIRGSLLVCYNKEMYEQLSKENK